MALGNDRSEGAEALSVQEDLPAAGGDKTRNNADQGGLARPVLADQSVHLALSDRETHVPQSDCARVQFGDIFQGEGLG